MLAGVHQYQATPGQKKFGFKALEKGLGLGFLVCMYVCMHVCVYIYIDLGSGAGDLTRVLCGLVACAS